MESYKHSCPRCGQHIEYTADYCGKQMQCPMCGQTVTFPAIPPGRAKLSSSSKKPEAAPKPKKEWKPPAALAVLRDFQHWYVIGQCVVALVIIAVLLAGAVYVKKKLGEPSTATDAAPVMQADPEAWQRMADLTKATQAMQAAAKNLDQANASLAYQEQALRRLDNGDALQRKAADERVQRAQITATAARQQFDAAEAKYRQLGGTTDYRSQLQRY
jgi:hypothetical protein